MHLRKSHDAAYEKVRKVLDTSLYPKMVVHHADGNPWNNENTNLVVCQDQTYHFLLHSRSDKVRGVITRRTFKYQRCYICHEVEHVRNLVRHKKTPYYCHATCLIAVYFPQLKEDGNGVNKDVVHTDKCN